mmetsp:Transcript_11579/g.8458  ORF Transcript_11579/g.8458 Transcript_11579/m.8458 type:complete len:172 (-) Transcript_11579:651-1166(-)
MQQGEAVKTMFNYSVYFPFTAMLYYFLIWYFFTMITSGTAIPCGIFIPCIIIGASVGEMYAAVSYKIQGDNVNIHPESYAVMGAAAMLSGSTRMTYSLAVLMLETTSNVDLFLPMITCLFTSYATGSIFTRSLYSGYMRSKQIPILRKDIPLENRGIVRAETIMNAPVKTF